jgi:branched-subunit amino acid aminotransferase/4-amino-4-deoxychorismate lyase
MFVMIDGEMVEAESLTIPYLDQGLQRGDGVFEFVRMYDGRYFALDEHLDRLEISARVLDLDLPSRTQLVDWFDRMSQLEDERDPIGTRLLVSRRAPGTRSVRCVLGVDALPPPKDWAMTVMTAPWQPAGRPWPLAGAKTLSYAPNMAAARLAEADGFDDAILTSEDGIVLECPRAAIAWITGGVIETPGLDLGILDSITRRHFLIVARRLGYEILEESFHVDRLLSASEVIGLSSAKEVASVVAIDDRKYPAGPHAAALAHAFSEHVIASL